MSARVDTKLKKDKFKKKVDDAGKLSPAHSENDDKIVFKVIDGEDIQSLAIKEENLKRVAAKEKPNLGEREDNVLVKKINKAHYPTVQVKVAKLVPEKPTKPIDTSDNLGISFDKYGNCVPHSILGNVEDFLQEAVANGKSIEMPYKSYLDILVSDKPAADLYLKPDTSEVEFNELSGDIGENALKNWINHMEDRKNTQHLISKITRRSIDGLVMNQSDRYLQYNDSKTLIDRTLPFLEDGKGYRLGSEFWYQPKLLGSEDTGIHTTLKKSEKGILPPIEHISKPLITIRESDFCNKQPTVKRYPWDESKYLQHRLKTLEPLINELVPHKPLLEQLQVVGRNPLNKNKSGVEIQQLNDYSNLIEISVDNTWINPSIKNTINKENNPYYINRGNSEDDALGQHPDVVEDVIFGPAILFGGQTANWTGNENENAGIVALESRLNFETKAGKRVLATFEIHNIGTTSIYFDWRKIPQPNHFDIINPKVQRFYFDTRSNVILPGDVQKIHVVFKSKKGGIFSEKWEFIAHPQLLSAASLILTLRGIAIQEDKFKKTRVQIEKKLFSREAEMIAMSMVDLLLSGVRTPMRPQTPQNDYLTEEDMFLEKNPQFCYEYDAVQGLKKLFLELFDEQDRPNHTWNLSIDNLKENIMSINENDPNKQNLLISLNGLLENMSFSQYVPNESKMYSVCYNLICSTMDEVIDELNSIKSYLNLPVTIYEDILPLTDEFNNRYEDWKKEFEIFKQVEAEKKARAEKDNKGGAKKKPDNKKDDKKKDEKKKPTPVQSGKKSAKSASDQTSRSGSRTQDKTPDRIRSPVVLTDAHLKMKNVFEEKAHMNIYHMLSKMFDNIEVAFDEIKSRVDNTETLANFVLEPKLPMPLNCDYID